MTPLTLGVFVSCFFYGMFVVSPQPLLLRLMTHTGRLYARMHGIAWHSGELGREADGQISVSPSLSDPH